MLMMLSHCVVVRTFLVADGVSATGSDDGVSATGSADGFACASAGGFACASMLCALIKAFLCSSRAILVRCATALPAATRFGFFVLWWTFLKSLVDQYLPYICSINYI